MVQTYLEKIYHILMERKQTLEHDITKLKYDMEEDQQFIRVLDEKTDRNFESLTPRIVNEKNKVKIKELQDHIKENKVSCETLESQLTGITDELEKCEAAIQCENDNKMEFKKMKELANRGTADSPVANENFLLEDDFLNNLVHQIQFCIDLSIMDSGRCKIELMKIRENLMKKLIYQEENKTEKE
ncbi:MAG: hypothetical protein ACI4DO_05670 [Roseburia sp.]